MGEEDENMITHAAHGRDRVPLTRLGMGTSQFGNLSRPTTDEDCLAAVDEAWEAGVRYFDTAPHYGLGLSERRLGRALAGRPRDEYVVSTKVGRLLVPDPDGASREDDEGFAVPADHRRVWDFSRAGVLASLEGSLERMGLDRVDIVYLHDPDEHWAEASTSGIDALIELREQGVIGAIGVGMNQAQMLTRFVRTTDIDLVMVAGRYTLLDQSAADELLPAALERGIGVVAAGVYNSGVLSRPRPAPDAHYDYHAAPFDVLERLHAIADVCQEFGLELPDAATQFPGRHPAVVSTVLGLRTAEHVRQACARMQANIPESLWGRLTDDGLVLPALSKRV